MTRHPVSVPASELVEQQIATVRQHYLDAVSTHRVLVRAAELGLELLAQKPELLVPTVKLT